MGERPSDSGAGAGGGAQDVTRTPRVVLLAIEVECADVDVAALDLIADQWAQDVRYQCIDRAVTVGAAVAMPIHGTLANLAELFAVTGALARGG